MPASPNMPLPLTATTLKTDKVAVGRNKGTSCSGGPTRQQDSGKRRHMIRNQSLRGPALVSYMHPIVITTIRFRRPSRGKCVGGDTKEKRTLSSRLERRGAGASIGIRSVHEDFIVSVAIIPYLGSKHTSELVSVYSGAFLPRIP